MRSMIALLMPVSLDSCRIETPVRNVPITDDAAMDHFYCYCHKEYEKKYLAWFQSLARKML